MYIVFVLIFILMFILSLLTYLKISKLSKNICDNYSFDPNSIYETKINIPYIIQRSYDIKVIFKPDNTFSVNIIVYDKNDTQIATSIFPSNKWFFNKNECDIDVVLDPDLISQVDKYASLDNILEIPEINKLALTANLLKLIPAKFTVTKSN